MAGQNAASSTVATPPPVITLAVTEDDAKSNTLSQDLLVYISGLEQAFNDIEDSDEKTIIQVNRNCFIKYDRIPENCYQQ